jgi:hypothetical protein
VEASLGDFFGSAEEAYDVIHFSHVVEHIPKYSLLYVVDALYKALAVGGIIIVRTPNMEGPAALSRYYVTLAHEYGFAGANLSSLLHICGFEDIRFHDTERRSGLRGILGQLARFPFILNERIKGRLFGVNRGGRFGSELVLTAVRGDFPPLFDPKYR